MSVIMVGADYIGNAITSAQHHNNISAEQIMHLLKCDIKQLHRYKAGTDLIPREIMRRIITYAVMTDKTLRTE